MGRGLLYRPARLHRLTKKVSLELIPELLKSLKIRAQDCRIKTRREVTGALVLSAPKAKTTIKCLVFSICIVHILYRFGTSGGSFRRTLQSTNLAQRTCRTGPPVYIGWNRVYPV